MSSRQTAAIDFKSNAAAPAIQFQSIKTIAKGGIENHHLSHGRCTRRFQIDGLNISDRPGNDHRAAVDSNRQIVPAITAVNLIGRAIISDDKAVIPSESNNRVRAEKAIDLIVNRGSNERIVTRGATV